ncbi:D(1B) dopamine receptor [Camelus ferus]|uniref:D(1A) dopamine receptor n=1 Tax=Camelus ferus TaxID=419612 RepID=A0A8B8UDS8_CAMFR|nr:D(1B) dopamine receptor [Camelus ferus]
MQLPSAELDTSRGTWRLTNGACQLGGRLRSSELGRQCTGGAGAQETGERGGAGGGSAGPGSSEGRRPRSSAWGPAVPGPRPLGGGSLFASPAPKQTQPPPPPPPPPPPLPGALPAPWNSPSDTGHFPALEGHNAATDPVVLQEARGVPARSGAPAQRTVSAPGARGSLSRGSRGATSRVPDGAALGAQGRSWDRTQPASAAEPDILPPGRNASTYRARSGQQQLAQGGAVGGSEGAAPLGPAQVVTAGLLTLLIVWTLLGNVLVCAAIVRSRHLRAKMTNVFIVSLAVSDLFVALLVMPWKAVAEVAGYWPFGAFCDVWVAFDIMCSTASILNLCIISVDRYWAISRPFCYERKMTQLVALVMVGLVWTLSILISFIPVQLQWHRDKMGSWGGVDPPSNSANGTPWEEAGEPEVSAENCDSSLNRTYAISSSLISFYIPVAIMIVTYTRIYRIAQVQIRRISSLERAAEHAQSCRSREACAPDAGLRASIKKETKVLKTLSVIMGVFVCCWLPFFILNCMVPFCSGHPEGPGAGFPCVSETTFDVFVWFGWANSSLNPIIYAFNADFRQVFAQLLGCSHLCSRTQVETVIISNELISYNQDTVFHKEIAAAYIHMIPNVVTPDDADVDKQAEEESPFDRISHISPRSPGGDPAAQSVWELDCEGETSLGKITPFPPNGFH